MTSFVFSTLKGSSISFDTGSDVMIFSQFDGTANDFRFLDNGESTLIFKESDEASLLAGGAVAVTLQGVRLNQLTSGNFEFFGTSTAIIGDNTANQPVGDTDNDNADQVITGTSGNEHILGRGGNDSITAGAGDDFVNGNTENDTILGEDGNDELFGGGGQDTLLGGNGNDLMNGNADNDSLDGEGGNDTLFGDTGDDIIRSTSGNSSQQGNAGNDQMFGSAGTDIMRGGQGNDTISGAGGNDTVLGNAGDDSITLATGVGETAQIFGNEGNDIINIAAASAAATISINGNAGNDNITGSAGNDNILGGKDNDTLNGGAGADFLGGNFGDDSLVGAEGDDILRGGPGNDTVIGGTGNDQMFGGLGDDLFQFEPVDAETENNTVTGGAGEDTIVFTSATAATVINTNNMSQIDVIQVPTGIVRLTDVDLNRTDNGTIEVNLSAEGAGATLLLNTSSVSASQTVKVSRADDEIVNLEGGFSHRVFLEGGVDIRAGNGTDTIIGNEGVDSISSGTGRDSLTGGGGGDSFVINSSNSNATSGVDIITDFDRLSDSIVVDFTLSDSRGNATPVGGSASSIAEVEALIASASTNAGDVHIINVTSGGLSGNKFAYIEANTTLGYQSGSDYLIQFSGASTSLFAEDLVEQSSEVTGTLILGTSGVDTLVGAGGPDTLVSAESADQLTGAGAADTFRFDSISSNSTNGVDGLLDFQSGVDVIQISVAIAATNVKYTDASGTASSIAEVEALITGGFNNAGLGNGIGDLQVINITGGTLNGAQFAAIGFDSVAGYNAGADILIQLGGTSNAPEITDISGI
jgi:Ca2+-binding RTX toxin-like protein